MIPIDWSANKGFTNSKIPKKVYCHLLSTCKNNVFLLLIKVFL